MQKELEKKFSLNRVQKSGAIFNQKKAAWINKQYLQRKSIKNLMILFLREFNKYGAYIKSKNLIKVIKTIKNRISFIQELWSNTYYFFINPQKYDNQYIIINYFSILYIIQIRLLKVEHFYVSNLKRTISLLIYDHKLIMKQVFQLLRISLVGTLTGADIFLIMEILGKKETIKRIRNYY